MDKDRIGKNAGVVWNTLDDGKKWTYENLKKTSGLSDCDLWAAIGWLAREDKIFFETGHDGEDLLFISNCNFYF